MVKVRDVWFIPTLHPTPYTLNSTPYTYTLHPTLYTLHPTPYTLHPTPYTLGESTGLFSVSAPWWRIVVDEAHLMKNRSENGSI